MYDKSHIKAIARSTDRNHYEDLIQKLAEFILLSDDKKLPNLNYFEKWSRTFFRNTLTNYSYGKIVKRDIPTDFVSLDASSDDLIVASDIVRAWSKMSEVDEIDFHGEDIFDKFENFMVVIPESVNEVIKQYLSCKNMSQISKDKKIKYNTLRRVKRIIKKIKDENIS